MIQLGLNLALRPLQIVHFDILEHFVYVISILSLELLQDANFLRRELLDGLLALIFFWELEDFIYLALFLHHFLGLIQIHVFLLFFPLEHLVIATILFFHSLLFFFCLYSCSLFLSLGHACFLNDKLIFAAFF